MSRKSEFRKKIVGFLPEKSVDYIVEVIIDNNIHLIIANPRKTKLGDFKPPLKNNPARITVNGDIEKYEFLMTFMHELAHFNAWKKYKQLKNPHGKEWKKEYKNLILKLIEMEVFPTVIEEELKKIFFKDEYFRNNYKDDLRDLFFMFYNKKNTRIKDLKEGDVFITMDNKKYKILKKKRTRYSCINLSNDIIYSVHGDLEIKKKT